MIVDDDGLHGMVERCTARFLTAGLHSIYVPGFQAWGGVGMEIRYSGPDTGGAMTWMRPSPLPPAPAAPGAPAAAAVGAPAVLQEEEPRRARLHAVGEAPLPPSLSPFLPPPPPPSPFLPSLPR
jgi:hypothetical protein